MKLVGQVSKWLRNLYLRYAHLPLLLATPLLTSLLECRLQLAGRLERTLALAHKAPALVALLLEHNEARVIYGCRPDHIRLQALPASIHTVAGLLENDQAQVEQHCKGGLAARDVRLLTMVSIGMVSVGPGHSAVSPRVVCASCPW